MNATTRNFSELAGRVLLAVLFLVAGLGKLGAYMDGSLIPEPSRLSASYAAR